MKNLLKQKHTSGNCSHLSDLQGFLQMFFAGISFSVHYFLNFPQFFRVPFDLQKGIRVEFLFPSDQMRRARFMDIFQERNELIMVNYVKEMAKI